MQAATKIQVGSYILSCHLPPQGTDECLLFLHGLQSRKEIFDDLRQTLARSFTIPHLAVDSVGFGDSDKPENFSYDLKDQQDVILALLKKLGISRVHIIGHSRGGMLGTLMLSDVPDMVQSLMSLEGNLCLEDCGESRKVAELPFNYFSETYYPALKQKLATSDEPSAAFRYQSLSLIPDYAFYRTSQTTVTWSKSNQLRDIFGASKQPKLLIYGQNGSFHSRPNQGLISLSEIPDSGHFMIIDNPTATADAIKRFLKPILPNP